MLVTYEMFALKRILRKHSLVDEFRKWNLLSKEKAIAVDRRRSLVLTQLWFNDKNKLKVDIVINKLLFSDDHVFRARI
jgi:hypothetical protein